MTQFTADASHELRAPIALTWADTRFFAPDRMLQFEVGFAAFNEENLDGRPLQLQLQAQLLLKLPENGRQIRIIGNCIR